MGRRAGDGLRIWEAAVVRGHFLVAVLPTGLLPVATLGGLVTFLVGGSLLDLFEVDVWLGIWIVTVAVALAALEGTFRRWRSADEIAAAGGAVPPVFADVLSTMVTDGEALLAKVKQDETWGVVHQQSGLPAWSTAATEMLNEEVPELAVWFHQMESPSRRPTTLPDDPKESFLAQFQWAINRLADIEDIVRARDPEGHPGGRPKTEQLLLLDRCLQLVQEASLLHRQIPPGLGMFPGQLDAELANRRITDCSGRLQSALIEIVGRDRADDLIAEATLGAQPTVRAELDPTEVETFIRRQQALRDALRLDELTIRP
jgi:hypothetical protein